MLKDRSLVTLSREPGGRAGVDRYGPLAPRLGRDRGWSRYEDYGSEVPTAAVGTAGDPPIAPRGEPQPFYRLKRDVEYIHYACRLVSRCACGCRSQGGARLPPEGEGRGTLGRA